MKTIELTQGQIALVSDGDFEFLSQFGWYARWSPDTKTFYATRYGGVGKPQIQMHRVVINAPSGMDVDHINHVTLDNTRENLRIVTRRQNTQNKNQKALKFSSMYPGVNYYKRTGRWRATIRIGGVNKHLGYFVTELEAHEAYEREFCRL